MSGFSERKASEKLFGAVGEGTPFGISTFSLFRSSVGNFMVAFYLQSRDFCVKAVAVLLEIRHFVEELFKLLNHLLRSRGRIKFKKRFVASHFSLRTALQHLDKNTTQRRVQTPSVFELDDCLPMHYPVEIICFSRATLI